MRCGVTVHEFWDLTPRETTATIEAAIWRDHQTQRQAVAQAWRTAALTRAKRLPSLAQLLAAGRSARPLAGAELARRRAEFQEMTAHVDMKQLTQQLAQRLTRKAVDHD